MDLNKNNNLIINACSVSIKSAYCNEILPNFTAIYGSPSSINFSSSSRMTTSGVYYDTKLELSYPGLKSSDFNSFHNLLHDSYYAEIKTSTEEILQIATVDSEMSMRTTYSIKSGHKIVFSGKSLIPPKILPSVSFFVLQNGIEIISQNNSQFITQS